MSRVSDVTEWFENQRDEFYNGMQDSASKFDALNTIWADEVEDKLHLIDLNDNIDSEDIAKLLEEAMKAKFACLINGEVFGVFFGTEQQLADKVAEAFRQGRKV